MTSEFKKILGHSVIYGLGNILQRMIGFFMLPIYTNTNILPQSEYGLISLLDNTVSICQIIVGMGLATAILRFYSEDKSREARETVISTAILFTTAMALVACALGCYFSTDLSMLIWRQRGAGEPFSVLMFILLFSSMIEIPLVVLRAREKSLVFLGVSIGRFTLACILNIFFIVILHKGAAGWLLSSLWTSVATCSYLVITTLGGIEKIRLSFPLLKRMLRYTIPLLPAALAMFWIHNGDRFILNAYHDKVAVAYYEVPYKFAMMVTYLVGQPFFLIWSVRMFDVFEQPGGVRIYARTFTYFSSVILAFMVILCVTIQDVIRIVSYPEYHSAYRLVPFVAMAYVLREFSDFFRGVLLIKRRTSFIGLSTLLAAVLCAVLYMVLIPPFAVWGAVSATVITFAAMAAFMFVASQHVQKVPYEYGRLSFMVGLALVLIGLINIIHVPQLYADLFLKGLLGMTFFPLLYALGFFTDEEKKKIARVFARIMDMLGLGNGP